jgi:hypothetical protein
MDGNIQENKKGNAAATAKLWDALGGGLGKPVDGAQRVRQAIAEGADIDTNNPLAHLIEFGSDNHGRIEAVNALIEAGANVNADHGKALIVASRLPGHNAKVIEILRAAGADEAAISCGEKYTGLQRAGIYADHIVSDAAAYAAVVPVAALPLSGAAAGAAALLTVGTGAGPTFVAMELAETAEGAIGGAYVGLMNAKNKIENHSDDVDGCRKGAAALAATSNPNRAVLKATDISTAQTSQQPPPVVTPKPATPGSGS